MLVRHSRALCCSTCMLEKSISKTFGSLMKRTFPLTALSISLTGAFGEMMIIMFLDYPPCVPRKSLICPLCPPKDILGFLFDSKQLLQSFICTFCVNLWQYKMPWLTLRIVPGPFKTLSAHIKKLISWISSMNISLNMLLTWIIQSIREERWIFILIHHL